MREEKTTAGERIETARACSEGEMSQSEAAKRLGLDKTTVREWVKRYEACGELALIKQEENKVYTTEMKRTATEEYLTGGGSFKTIAAKYGLRSDRTLRRWIKVYNSGGDFNRKRSGGSRMKNGRETTQEERIIIAKDCIENGCNYGETAIKHHVSYQQVYKWVQKFREHGATGLEDRRGKRIAAQEPRTAIEELKVKMAQLEHENYMLRMECNLLKKLDELERRDAFRK